jgi:muramoyltetrapeptide carboxypeptidase
MQIPEALKKGDTIAIATTARYVLAQEIQAAIITIETNGFKAQLSETIYAQENQFGGSDYERIAGLQHLLDNPEIKAIWFARGGYGTARIVDSLDFGQLVKSPKWLIGFSDLTVLLNHVYQQYSIVTLHAPMAMQADSNHILYNQNDISDCFKIITGNAVNYPLPSHSLSKPGNCEGTLVGGNLSVLCSVIGTESFPDTKGKILFLEDLDEYLYHIDRMVLNLKRNGFLENLSGLIVGGMNDMNDNAIKFGKSAEEILLEHTQDYNYPKYFGFSAGHCVPNHPLIIGDKVKIENNTLFLKAFN